MNSNTHHELSNNSSPFTLSISRLMRLTLHLPRTTYHSTDFETLSPLYAQSFFNVLDQQHNYPRSPTQKFLTKTYYHTTHYTTISI